ncbi:MAG: CoA pyrophosphatase [Deltaproteobacteria bacterium]|nr:CoA pyrophosphatase [Deltaproteobacteria bacterium]
MAPDNISSILQSRIPKIFPPGNFRQAAVLVPLQERQDGNHLILTQRAEGLNSHSGQVAFPGGSLEPGDAGPLEAALRESHEEVGIDPRHVRVLGHLDQVTAASDFLVTPIVGVIPYPYKFQLNPRETAAIFSVPVSILLEPNCMTVDPRPMNPRGPAYHFQYQDWDIWGATAKMIKQLLELAYGF